MAHPPGKECAAMRLLIHVVIRLFGVVLLCLACAVGWVLVDAHRVIEAETAASADRVARDLQNLYWRELLWRDGIRRKALIPGPGWESIATLRLIAPGFCVTFGPGDEEPSRLCSQTEAVGSTAPAWFATLYAEMFAPYAGATRTLT